MSISYCVIDFETTLDSANKHRAVEIALIEMSDRGVGERFVSLINPGCRIDYHTHAVHGISDRMVKNQPVWGEIWENLLKIMAGKTLIAHNAQFDASVLRNEIQRHKHAAPKVTWLCSCRLAKKVWPNLTSHRLADLKTALNLSGSNLHRAEADALLTEALVRRALSDLGKDGPKLSQAHHLGLHASIRLESSWPFNRSS